MRLKCKEDAVKDPKNWLLLQLALLASDAIWSLRCRYRLPSSSGMPFRPGAFSSNQHLSNVDPVAQADCPCRTGAACMYCAEPPALTVEFGAYRIYS